MPRSQLLWPALVIGLLVSGPTPLSADPAMVAQIADGRPWTTLGPGERAMELTFFPDGSARMRMGLLSMRMTWAATDTGLCLSGGPMGDRCISLEQTASGFIGRGDDGQVLELVR